MSGFVSAYAWYRREYPDAPDDYDPRCFQVLAAWQALYNIPRTGKVRRDGGFRPCGKGIEVHIPSGMAGFSTYDDDSLTRLVIAAHRYHCRVDISNRGRLLILMVHPRQPDGDHQYNRHPGLGALAVMAGAM